MVLIVQVGYTDGEGAVVRVRSLVEAHSESVGHRFRNAASWARRRNPGVILLLLLLLDIGVVHPH